MPDIDPQVTKVKRWHESAEQYYQQVRPYFAWLSTFLAPAQVGYYVNGSTSVERLTHLQSLASKDGVVLARQIADGLREDVLPTGRPFFSIDADDRFKAYLRELAEARVNEAGIPPEAPEYAYAVEAQHDDLQHIHREYREAMRMSIHTRLVETGGLAVHLGEIIHNLVVFGNAAWRVNLMQKQNIISVESIQLADIRLVNTPSPTGEPTIVFQRIRTTPEELRAKFPMAKNIEDNDKANPDRQNLYFLCQKRVLTDMANPRPDYYELYLVDDKFNKLLGKWEDIVPLISFAPFQPCHRRVVWRGHWRSHSWRRGDYELAKRDFLKAMKLQADPPMLVDEGLMKKGGLRIRPGTRIKMSTLTGEGDPVRPVQIAGNPASAMEVMRQLMDETRNNVAYTPGTNEAEKGITAYQWEAHSEEDAKRKSQVLHIIEFYVLRGIVNAAYERMREAKLLDAATRSVFVRTAPPLNQGELRLKFTGADAAVMRRLRVQRIAGFVQLAEAYDANPGLHAAMPREKFYAYLAEQFELPPDVVNSPAEIRAVMAQVQEQQQQLQAEQAEADGGNAGQEA